MKKITSRVLWTVLVFQFALTSCHKEIANQGNEFAPELSARVNNWLDKQKQGLSRNSNSSSVTQQVNSNEKSANATAIVKGANIDLLKTSLKYGSEIQLTINKRYNCIVLPINDDIKAKKHVEQCASLSLVLITDKEGKIISGNIACYLPKDGKAISAANRIADIYRGKLPADSGTVKYMSVTGQRLHQFEFKKGRMTSYGTITSKENSSTATNSLCIEWYLVTTYSFNDGSSYQTSEYLGTTCYGCDDPNYGSLCPDYSNGGGTSGSSNPSVDEIDVTVDDNSPGFDPTGGTEVPDGPEGLGTPEPQVRIRHIARKKLTEFYGLPFCYDVDIYPATILNPEVEYVAQNGTPIFRSAFFSVQRTRWHITTQPVAWIEWTATLNKEYAWWGGFISEVSPYSHVEIH